jgi:hypothetical protein
MKKVSNIQSNSCLENIVLDSQFALGQIGRENPKDLVVPNQEIVRIGNLCEVAFLKKINLSFNKLESLEGIDQLPQLRELVAYSNRIENISQINGITKLESIFLQQNKISSINNVFTNLTRLQDLRLDKNKISKVEHLNQCQALKSLNLSSNILASLDGLHGLQNLQELFVSNNNIKSLTSLKGLPLLRELDVSHNQLKSLDGIQYLPKLEVLHVEHNQIVHLQFPTYSNSKSSGSLNSNSLNSIDSEAKPPTNTKLPPQKKSSIQNNKGGATSGNNATSRTSKSNQLPSMEQPILSEIYLQHNRIKSVQGLEIYSNSVEILDLSSNQITLAASIEFIQNSLSKCEKLQDIRFHNNPVYENGINDAGIQQLKTLLLESCPHLESCDDLIVLNQSNSKVNLIRDNSRSNLLAKNESSDYLDTQSVISLNSKEFHTWEKESTIDNEEGSESTNMISTTSLTGTKPLFTGKFDKNSDGDSDEEENKTDIQELDTGEDNANEAIGIQAPRLTLKSMLTEEQIKEKEFKFTCLLEQVKLRLAQVHSVFDFIQENGTDDGMLELNKVITSSTSSAVKEIQVNTTSKLITALDDVLATKGMTQTREVKTSLIVQDNLSHAENTSEHVLNNSSMEKNEVHIKLNEKEVVKVDSVKPIPRKAPESGPTAVAVTGSSSVGDILSLSSGVNRHGTKLYKKEVDYLQHKRATESAILLRNDLKVPAEDVEIADFASVKITSDSRSNKFTFLKNLNKNTNVYDTKDVASPSQSSQNAAILPASPQQSPTSHENKPYGIGYDIRYHQSVVTPLILKSLSNDSDMEKIVADNGSLEIETSNYGLLSTRSEKILNDGENGLASLNSGYRLNRASSAPLTRDGNKSTSKPFHNQHAFISPRIATPHVHTLTSPNSKSNTLFK